MNSHWRQVGLAISLSLTLGVGISPREEKPATGKLAGHRGRILDVAFSPDGKLMVSAGDDHVVKVWDVGQKKLLHTFAKHSASVYGVAFSPDGKWVASCSGGYHPMMGTPWGEVHVWDYRSGQVSQTFRGHSHLVTDVAFSPDGKLIVSGSWDRTARVWSATTGKQLHILQGDDDASVWGVAFSPDGKLVASAGLDQTVKLWDVKTGKLLKTLKVMARTWSVAFSPDGQRIVSCSGDTGNPGLVKVWDVETGKLLLTLKGHQSTVRKVVFSPDGKLLATLGLDGTLKLWNAQTGRELPNNGTKQPNVEAFAISPDGKKMVIATTEELRFVDLNPKGPEQKDEK